ncbi:MAG: acyl-CoA dehydrogenase C-terminal domain-containing protein [Betaproteobacteria bacterium]|nr:acyl-CoA dehydrogenase C-terminal domain-containing protein [Betaproteobacteria bacterium]
MSDYKAPLRDIQFVLKELAGLDVLAKLPGCEELSGELVDQILEESAKFSSGVLAPLNRSGDVEGSVFENGQGRTPKGFKEAYRQFVEGGWNALQFPPEFGGQGLPKIVGTPVMEMWKSANMSFSLCPLLTGGAIEALLLRGSEELKRTFLPKMVEGAWTGTMNLTEPQAGTDLGLLKTRAAREGDHYRVSGQKIFITYGEHDLAENIIHLVLARTPEAPPGVKGISLFIVPKFLVNADGSLGARNDVHCASIEHKLGIHASPTAVLVFGEKEGAVGYLVGEENRGLETMFIMMNAARFAVGLEGVAISERAYQQALAYAKERIQSPDLAGGGKSVPIIRHPDVRRMLMSMKALTEAMRALAYVVAAAIDTAHHHPDKAERAKQRAFVDFLIPVVKGWSTETGIEVASIGIQVHGGMGYIEETGAAQYLRDARIATIYEGTTGIQSNDLVGRKLAREGGATAKAVIGLMRATDAELARAPGEDLAAIRASLSAGISAMAECVEWIVKTYGADIKAVHAGSVPFLKLVGVVAGGWQMARSALVAQKKIASGEGDQSFYGAKIGTARFYAEHVLSQAGGLRDTVVKGAAGVMALAEDQF